MNPKILTTDTTFRSLVDVLSLIVTTHIYNKFCLLIIHTNIKLSQTLWQKKSYKDWPIVTVAITKVQHTEALWLNILNKIIHKLLAHIH